MKIVEEPVFNRLFKAPSKFGCMVRKDLTIDHIDGIPIKNLGNEITKGVNLQRRQNNGAGCQRSGRAGREGPGKCFRLYPESEFDKLIDSTVPEIKRCNLVNIALSIDDILGFDFMEKPSRFQMARLPLDPMYSKALILAADFKCLEEMLVVVAMLSVETLFYFTREKAEELVINV